MNTSFHNLRLFYNGTFFHKFVLFRFISITLLSLLFFFQSTSKAQVIIPLAYWSTACTHNVNNVDNNSTTGFFAGTLSSINWNGSSLTLNAAQTSGNYLSPPFNYSDCYNTPLKYLAWTSTLPFGKELPATSETSTNYSAILANLMTSLNGLWHFNEIGGTTFTDSSASALTGTLTGGVTLGSPGKFQNSITLNGTTGYVSFGTASAVTGLGNYSISLWIYPSSLGSNQGIIRKNDNDSSQGYLVNLISGGGIQFSTVYSSVDTERRTSTLLTVNQWNHLVVTSDASLTATNAHVYINGAEASYSTTTNGSGSHTAPATFNLQLGFAGTTYNLSPMNYFNGKFDELAMWTRILSATEVQQIYRRGINRIKFQIRQCLQANCSDNPSWKGPDGTSATYFTEINNNSNQDLSTGSVLTTAPNLIFSNFLSLGLINTKAFQYQTIFETDNTAYGPDLKTVILSH